jgi:predicted DNA-binding protein (MmcQ/YjbR family)
MSVAHQESRYWLRIIQAALLDDEEVRALIRESDELVRILYTIVQNARQSRRSKTGR